MEKLRQEYDTNMGPDGIRAHTEIGDFQQAYKQHDPVRVPDDDAESDVFHGPWEGKHKDVGEREYGPQRSATIKTLGLEDSAKFGSGKPYNF